MDALAETMTHVTIDGEDLYFQSIPSSNYWSGRNHDQKDERQRCDASQVVPFVFERCPNLVSLDIRTCGNVNIGRIVTYMEDQGKRASSSSSSSLHQWLRHLSIDTIIMSHGEQSSDFHSHVRRLSNLTSFKLRMHRNTFYGTKPYPMIDINHLIENNKDTLSHLTIIGANLLNAEMLRSFPKLTELKLGPAKFTEGDIRPGGVDSDLLGFLRKLHDGDGRDGDGDGDFPNLKRFELHVPPQHREKIDMRILASHAMPSLEYLWIDGVALQNIAALKSLSNLKELSLTNTRISGRITNLDIAIFLLKNDGSCAMKNLSKFHLNSDDSVSNIVVDVAALEHCTEVRDLALTGGGRAKFVNLDMVLQSHVGANLIKLDLSRNCWGYVVTYEGSIEQSLSNCKRLEELNMSGTKVWNTEFLQFMTNLLIDGPSRFGKPMTRSRRRDGDGDGDGNYDDLPSLLRAVPHP